ncbi:restriction endonuclease [Streptomyces sp. NPDC006662]|uniref:nSTAND3 domain-containing NTPase n=1 Tax=Streptomyces sp. NPDC006662 TaxID=3156902 RepID=UPI00340D8D00
MTSTGEVVAVGSPRFTLHTLGWRAFQDLCAAVLREVWGQSVKAFADSNDGGRDGVFYGTWSSPDGPGPFGDVPAGPFVLQCKHSKKADATLSPSELDDEFAKAAALVERGECGTYVLLTNARVTGTSEEEIRRRLRASGVAHPLVLDGQWLSDMIASHRGLRMFVPRVYGLGDLSQILDERAYSQATLLMASAPEQVATFVVTSAYRKAARALRDHGFVVLLGDPAVGKSVIALMLAISAADNWGCPAVKARTSEDLVQRWNPHEREQFFWLDDAFGAVRHEEHLTHAWARDLPHVMSAIKNGARVVLTSRSYIYNEARPLLKTYAYPLLHEQQVTVDVAELTRTERQQILYNHVAAGDQPNDVRTQMKPHLEAAADAAPFRPEAARRLGLEAFTGGLSLTRQGITTFMVESQQLLSDVYDQLDPHAQAALALTYATATGRTVPGLPNPIDLDAADRDIIERAGSTPARVSKALAAVTGTFLRLSMSPEGQSYWTFHHPTLREAFAAWLTTQPHLLPLVLMGMDDQALLTRTDSLDPTSEQRQGTLLRVPPSLYQEVARRMAVLRQAPRGRLEPWQRHYDRQQVVQAYLVHNSCDAFLRAYTQEDPQVYDELLAFGSPAEYDARTTLLGKLHKAGCLPEKIRQRAVARMRELAVTSPDAAWVEDKDWQKKVWHILLTDKDREELFTHVRQDLLPRLWSRVDDWLRNATSDDDDPVDTALLWYSMAFEGRDDFDTAAELDAARDMYNDERRTRPPSSNWTSGDGGQPNDGQAGGTPTESNRSIFDDIDH